MNYNFLFIKASEDFWRGVEAGHNWSEGRINSVPLLKPYIYVMLTLKHKQALCPQFQKLAQLDSLGFFTNEFIIGFVCGQLPSPINKYEWKTLSDKLEKMKKMVLTKAITVHNVIEVLLVSLATIADLLSSSKTQTSGLELRRFMLALDENTNEVIINPNVLKEKYFHETEETENKKRRGEINNKK